MIAIHKPCKCILFSADINCKQDIAQCLPPRAFVGFNPPPPPVSVSRQSSRKVAKSGCLADRQPPLLQVGSFPNWDVWAEWNGAYRDVVRRFVKGDGGMKKLLATRLSGSADL